MKTTSWPGMVLAVALLASSPARAGSEQPLAIDLSVHRVWREITGADVLVATEQARPGDLLEYRAKYRNTGTAAARQVIATLPIPATGAVFVPGSAMPSGALASIDGRHFEALPLRRWVTLPDGTREQRLVPPQEYRAIRWNLGEVAAGQVVSVSARVRVETPEAMLVGESAR